MATQTTVPGPEKSFLEFKDINTAAGGVIVIVPAVPGTRIRLYRAVLQAFAPTLATFQDTAAVEAFPQLSLGALTWDFDGLPWLETDLEVGLDINLSAAVQVSGRIWYTQRGDE